MLEEQYPESPQAFEVRQGTDGDLLGYLLDRQEQAQAARFAALTPEEREELNTITGFEEALASGALARSSGLRRRMIYLARRDNLVFEPSEELLAAAAVSDEAASQVATFPATPLGAAPDGPQAGARADSLGIVPFPAASDSTLIIRDDILGPDGKPLPQVPADPAQAAKDAAKKAEEEKKKKKKDPNRFDLR